MKYKTIPLILSLCLLILIGEGCSSRRSNRGRSRHQETSVSQSSDNSTSAVSRSNFKDEMESLAQTQDYDRMLNELNGAIRRLKGIKKNYFAGKLSDKELQQQLNDLENDYQPIIDRLEKASEEGELNYKQHKKQMALFADWIKEWESAISKIINDFAGEMN